MIQKQVIKLVEISVKPELLNEVQLISAKTLELTLAEPGVVSFHQTCKADDPYTLVFFEVFADEQAYQSHLEQPYTKEFMAVMQDKFSAAPTIDTLVNL